MFRRSTHWYINQCALYLNCNLSNTTLHSNEIGRWSQSIKLRVVKDCNRCENVSHSVRSSKIKVLMLIEGEIPPSALTVDK